MSILFFFFQVSYYQETLQFNSQINLHSPQNKITHAENTSTHQSSSVSEHMSHEYLKFCIIKMIEMELQSPDDIPSPHLLCNCKIFQYSSEQMLFIVSFWTIKRHVLSCAFPQSILFYLMFSSCVWLKTLVNLQKNSN